MALTEERITEICVRYGLIEQVFDSNNEFTGEYNNLLDGTSMKVYHAPKNSVNVNDLKKSMLTDSDTVQYWSTVINGNTWELVFDIDPELKDPENVFTEIRE